MKGKCIFILAFFVLSLNMRAQEIITDRPDQTESSSTVPAKSLQIEAGLSLENYSDNTRRQLQVPGVLFRYGLTRGIELRLGEQLLIDNHRPASSQNLGLGDIELGAKIQILKKENINTEIAFLSHLVLPTGMDSLSNNKAGTINKLAISHSINDYLGFGYNIGYDYLGDGNGDLTFSVALGAGLTEKLGAYIEYYGGYVEFEELMSNFDSGLTYLIQENLQLDISFGLGLNYQMNYFSIGASWNISKN